MPSEEGIMQEEPHLTSCKLNTSPLMMMYLSFCRNQLLLPPMNHGVYVAQKAHEYLISHLRRLPTRNPLHSQPHSARRSVFKYSRVSAFEVKTSLYPKGSKSSAYADKEPGNIIRAPKACTANQTSEEQAVHHVSSESILHTEFQH